MCGITGLFYQNDTMRVEQSLLNKMTDSLTHRGPDDRGIFIDKNIGLGFRRLSIIDLSRQGNQPMLNEDSTVCIVCNGEIYNFVDLKHLLETKGHIFRSRTDIEVIIHSYEEYGVDCLQHIDGMFAFAIWDSKRGHLFLARDRFGIKPLHYYYKDGIFAFGSEIKAIQEIPQASLNIDYKALWNYFSLMQIPAPQTIYKDIRKFLPSEAMLVKGDGTVRRWQYWDILVREDNSKSEEDWAEELKALFEKAIMTHLAADVPVGCFLSGGIDSSAVVAYAAKIKREPIKTYSISFAKDGLEFDESPKQRLVSRQFDTDHYEIIVGPDILNVVDLLIRECDEPFAVPSAIGLYHVSKLASSQVKVVLSGYGGDELFAGYVSRYDRDSIFNWTAFLPVPAKEFLKYMSGLVPIELDRVSPLRKIRKFLEFASMSDAERYTRLLSIYSMEQKLSVFNPDIAADMSRELINDYYAGAWSRGYSNNLSKLNRRLYYDIKTSLPDEMLTKMDRCTSMVSIEGRVPFLDKMFVECAMKIPWKLKYSRNNGKKVFKRLLRDVLPPEVIESKKQGFNVPINNWLANDNEKISYNSQIFNNKYLTNLKKRYCNGDKRFGYHFWILKCFNVWEHLRKGVA